MSAKAKMLEYLKKHVGRIVSREKLSEIADVHEWARSLRTLRQEGWQLESVKDGYILKSTIKKDSKKKRVAISGKVRYQVLQRDNSTCQRCGKTPKDGVKLEADHKIPVEWGGSTDIDNLWTLCNLCNNGKKHFFADFDADVMAEVMKQRSGWQKLATFFRLNPNKVIEPIQLHVISGIRDWTRTLRNIRDKEKMQITWLPKSPEYPQGGYLYKPK